MKCNYHLLSSDPLNRNFLRYLKFVYNIRAVFETDTKDDSAEHVFFINENELVAERFLRDKRPAQKRKIIITGTRRSNDEDYINLLELNPHLKALEPKALQKSNGNALRYNEEFESKLQLFFKGHGEESLFSALTMAIHLLKNGPEQMVYFSPERNEDEYVKIFINPGLEKWDTFTRRFDKYRIYLESLGFEEEIKLIYGHIIRFNEFLNTSGFLKNISLLPELQKFQENIEYLNLIDHILTTIAQTLGITDVPVQDISRR